MSVLDQGLSMIGKSPMAPGAVLMGGPSADPAAPTAAPPMAAAPDPNSALGRSMAFVDVARQQAAQDPMMAKMETAMAADNTARDEAAAKVSANTDKIQQLVDQPDAEHIPVPRLHELPAPPTPEHKDPMRVFGQFLPVLAALGALTTREPAINALNAATAMLSAAKRNDKEEEDTQRQAWMDNTKTAIENNNQLIGQYKLALEDKNLTATEKMARINGLAAMNRDYVTVATLKSGNMQAIDNYVTIMEKTSGQLASVYNQQSRLDFDRSKWEDERILQNARLSLDQMKAGQVSMGDTIGPILLKISKAGVDPKTGAPIPNFNVNLSNILTPAERQALRVYYGISNKLPYSDDPSAKATGANTGWNAPPAADAAAAPAVAPAAQGRAAQAAPMAVPQNPKEWKPNQVYQTPKGPMQYRADGKWYPPPQG